MRKTLGLVLGLILLAPGAWAQTASGQIYGVVTDESGAVLPGANVTISGANIGARSTTSGSQGEFRFLNLVPGPVQGRRHPHGALHGLPRGQGADRRQRRGDLRPQGGRGRGDRHGHRGDADRRPQEASARRPTSSPTSWTRSAGARPLGHPAHPGVLIDRVNIGGNESGQQSGYVGQGRTTTHGVVGRRRDVTDMAASAPRRLLRLRRLRGDQCRPAATTSRWRPAAWRSTWSPSAAPTPSTAAAATS